MLRPSGHLVGSFPCIRSPYIYICHSGGPSSENMVTGAASTTLTFDAHAPAFLVLATILVLSANAGGVLAQTVPVNYSQVVEHRLAEKKKEVDTNVVAPCKGAVETQVKSEETREKTCGCIPTSELEKSLQRLHQAKDHDVARCDIKGADAELEYINEQEQAHIAHLRALGAQFQQEINGFETSANDAEKGHDEAVKKAEEIGLGYIAQQILALTPKENTDRIDSMTKRADQLVDPRRVRGGDLKAWVVALRQQLAGKSNAEAKAVILESLRRSEDVAQIHKQIIGDLARTLPQDGRAVPEEAMRSVLDESYGTIMTGVEIAKDHGVKLAVLLGKATTLLAYAPDAIDTADLLYRSNVLETNLVGLDQLRAAAEEQRNIAEKELKVLVHERRTLEDQRSKFQEKMKR